MNLNPSHIGPGAARFRAHATPPGDTTPTERLTGFRQPQQPPADHRSTGQPTDDSRPRSRRTRRTVDLPAATHRALDIWQRDAADRIGVARVTGQEVLTALIDQLLADPNLGAQVVRAISDRR